MKAIITKILLFTGIAIIMIGCDTSYPGDIKAPDPLWKLCTKIQGSSGQIMCTNEIIGYNDGKCSDGFDLVEIYNSQSSCNNALEAFQSDFRNGGY